MSKIDNFTPTKNPDNRVLILQEEKIDDIIIGASCTHVFSLGFIYSTYVKASKIIYKQGLDVILVKYPKDFSIEESECGHTFLTVVLQPEDTIKFKDSPLETTVQMQITNVNGEVLYNNPNRLLVKKPTDDGLFTPSKLEKVKDYVYEIDIDKPDYDYALQYFYSNDVSTSLGGCSSIRSGNFFGRNKDWFNNYNASFIVRCNGKKYKSLGISSGIAKLTEDFVNDYKCSDSYKLVPFVTLDGINEKGVACSINATPSKGVTGELYSSQAKIQTRYEIFGEMVIRYILDNFDTAKAAVEYLRDYVNIVSSSSVKSLGFAPHWLIADENNTYALEIINGELNIIEEQKIMTNFYLTDVVFNSDDTVYTPYDVMIDQSKKPSIKNNIKLYGIGLERYNVLVNKYNYASESLENMREVMNKIMYSHAYTYKTTEQKSNEYPFYTEWTGDYLNLNRVTYTNATVDMRADAFELVGDWRKDEGGQYVYYPSVIQYNKDLFRKGKLDGQTGTWITTNSSIYDIKNKKLNVVFQEDGEELNYTL